MDKYSTEKEFIIMDRDQVRAFDTWAINTVGIPPAVLMENAGRSCAELIIEELADIDRPAVAVFCGTGNNGGDGYVIARHLLNKKFDVKVIICGDPAKIKGDAKINLDVLINMGQKIDTLDINDPNVKPFTDNTDMIVDAIFGTGLKGQLKGEYVQLINNINAADKTVLAVDIPSGMDCNTGESTGQVIKADYTVTFVAVKKGFTVSTSAKDYTGQIYIASIGIVPTKDWLDHNAPSEDN